MPSWLLRTVGGSIDRPKYLSDIGKLWISDAAGRVPIDMFIFSVLCNVDPSRSLNFHGWAGTCQGSTFAIYELLYI